MPDDSTRMGFMTRSKDGNKDNASYLFFEDRPGSEAVELHSEKHMKVSVENDKTVNVDGNRTTTILKEQKDDVTGDASFYYRAKRTSTVDQEETTTFNNSQTETIKNVRKLNITSGGDVATIKGDSSTDVEVTELHHVTQLVTEKFDSGLHTTIAKGAMLNITSDGSVENIKGNVSINVEGEYTKLVSRKIVIKAPSIVFDSPSVEYKHKEDKSFWEDYFSFKIVSLAFKGGDASVSLLSSAFKGIIRLVLKFLNKKARWLLVQLYIILKQLFGAWSLRSCC
ncbi:bacteriophage T4 gp5 trimerisation domain-containing protein [Kosakonia cowanii]|jgi:type VI secretion system secreted protein VgrG